MLSIPTFSKSIITIVILLTIFGGIGLLFVTKSAEAPSVSEEFGETVSFIFAGREMLASVADTPEERRLGLSYTTVLPPHVAKVFIFDISDRWGFWMKDMNYAIDIFWISADGVVVHIEPNVSPDTYPRTFVPNVAAMYAIETVAGFAYDNNVYVGMHVDMSSFLVAK